MATKREDEQPKIATEETKSKSVRAQIKQMTGHSSVESMEAELPDSTANMGSPGTNLGDGKPKRTRRTKAEMEASRGSVINTQTPAPMPGTDPRYDKAVKNLATFGASGAVKRGLEFAAKAKKDDDLKLTKDEETKIDDYFYVVSTRTGFNPMNSWYGLMFVFLLLVAEIAVPRLLKYSDFGKEFEKFFKPKLQPPQIESTTEDRKLEKFTSDIPQ